MDKIVILVPHAIEYITRHGCDRDKIVWLPNGVDICDFVGTSYSSKGKGDGVFIKIGWNRHFVN